METHDKTNNDTLPSLQTSSFNEITSLSAAIGEMNIQCFYGRLRPLEEDYVVVEVTQIIEGSGLFVKLLEYGGCIGFVGIREVSSTRFKKLKGILKVGSVEVMQVITIQGDHIDLTRKMEDLNMAEKALQNYRRHKAIHEWFIYHAIEYSIEQKMGYLHSVLQSSSEVIPDEYQLLHKDVLERFPIHLKTSIDKPSQEITQKEWIHKSISDINHHLQLLEEMYKVDITIVNAKKNKYRITSRIYRSDEEWKKTIDAILQQDMLDIPKESPILTTIEHVSSQQPLLNIGIIGHVSHGKTTLIQSLTGVDTRRYKNEIQTNRTLKLGYTNITVTQCHCNSEICYKSQSTCGCPSIPMSIIDCPGHHVLLSTMMAGASLMDMALLVVAANESFPQHQTIEHLNIIKMIDRVDNILCVQNKIDLVSKEIAFQQKEFIQEHLKEYDIPATNIIPVSAQQQINIDVVLKALYLMAEQKLNTKNLDTSTCSYGLTVRTFDVNKPGNRQLQGMVLGGSILHGSFQNGDTIQMMPYNIKGTIQSIQSDQISLSQARPGGLIGIQTDIHPMYCESLIGSSFIKIKDYQEDHYYPNGSIIDIKYYPLHGQQTRFQKGHKVTIHLLATSIECLVIKNHKQKNLCQIQLTKPLYVYNDFRFILFYQSQMYGYGKEIHTTYKKLPSSLFVMEDSYDTLYDSFAIEKFKSTQISLPLPKIEYSNTYSTIVNFKEICDKLYVLPYDLGHHIFVEQGLRKWSINGNDQMVLKGRMSEKKIMSILSQYCRSHMCQRCKSLHTHIKTVQSVKKIQCEECQWSEPYRV